MRVASGVHGETQDAEGYDTAPIMAAAAVLVACGGAVATSVPGTSAPTAGPTTTTPRPTITLAPRQLQA